MLKRLNTLEGIVFWTDHSNFRKVQLLLREKGLVDSNDPPPEQRGEFEERFDDCLVYEENSIGLYRCSFHREHQEGPNFEFKYFERRLRSEGILLEDDTLLRDPMKPVVLAVYELLKPVKVTNYDIEPIVLE